MNDKIKSMSLRRKLIFSFLPLLFIIIIGEFAARCIYFQLHSPSSLAIICAFNYVLKKVHDKDMHKKVEDALEYKKKYNGTYDTLFSSDGAELLWEFKKRYEVEFRKLVKACQKARTKLIILYIPSKCSDSNKLRSENSCSNFYQYLSNKYRIHCLDLTPGLQKFNCDDFTLLPENGHFSRYGNKIIAERLNIFLRKYHSYRNPLKRSNHISVYGDLVPSAKDIWKIDIRMPYMVVTNREGFRNNKDLAVHKNEQRVLILGDSYTFGPYLPNHDTYPALLQKINPELEVINAGIAGYTITDETSLFIERAQYVAPDITVLQVSDNDLYGLFYFKMNFYDRERKTYTPSVLEETFLRKIAERNGY